MTLQSKIEERSVAFVLACSTLTTSGYALSSMEGARFHLLLLAPITCLILYVIAKNKISLLVSDKNAVYFYFIFIFISLASTFINAGLPNIFAAAKFWIIITFAYLFTCLIDVKSFAKYLISFMSFLAMISVFVYIIVNGLNIDLPLPVYKNINDMGFQSGYIFFVYDNHLVYRNMGPFWEPGIYGTYLTATIFVLLSGVVQYKKFTILILITCLITTMSTAAIIFLFLLASFWVTSKKVGLSHQIIIFLIGVIAILFVVANITTIINILAESMPLLFSKFTNTESLSVVERIASPMTNIELFIQQPYLGLGLADQRVAYQQLTLASQTSTTTYFLASFGIFGGLYTLGWIYGIFKIPTLSLVPKVILLFFVISVLNKEPHSYFSLTYIFLFYLIRQNSSYTQHLLIESRTQTQS